MDTRSQSRELLEWARLWKCHSVSWSLQQDNTDRQFRTFRDGLPSLIALASVYLACSKTYSFYLSRRVHSTPVPPSTPNPTAPYERIPFLVTITLVILVTLHGISALKILILLYLNYKLHSITGNGKMTPYAIWSFNIAMLFSNELFKGYPLGGISSHLAFIVSVQSSFIIALY